MLGIFKRFFGNRRTSDLQDPILSKCKATADTYGLRIEEREWHEIKMGRDEILSSPLGGAYIQKDVLDVLCFLCVFDALFETGMRFLEASAYREAIKSFEKARTILPWPTVLYAQSLSFQHLNETFAARKLCQQVLDNTDHRLDLLSKIIPMTTPNRDAFLQMTRKRVDTNGILSVGLSGFEELRKAAEQVVIG